MSSIKKNLSYNLIYQVFILIVPLLTAPYISRVLGASGVGTYSYIASVSYYFFIAITLGLNNYGNRAIAKASVNKENLSKTFWSIYFMQLFLGVIAIIAYIVYILAVVNRDNKIYYLLYSPYILSAVFDINWFFYGLTEFKFTTIRSTVVKLLSLVFVFSLVNNEEDLHIYLLILGLSTLLSNLLLWTKVPKFVNFYIPHISEITIHFLPNIILFIPILAISIYRVMDKIMISSLSGVVQNGYYENADKIITMTLTAFSAVATVMMPSISGLVAKGEEKRIRTITRDSMQISMFLGTGIMFGLLAIGDYSAVWYFGVDYYETGVLIRLLSFTVILSGWKAVLRSQYLIPFEKDRPYIISLIIGAAINVILNLVFIPKFQARGAVIGTIVAETTGFIIQTYVCRKGIDLKRLLLDSLPFIPSGIIMYVLLRFSGIINSSIVRILLSVGIGGTVYLVASLTIMFFVQKDRIHYWKKKVTLRKSGAKYET